MKPLEGIEVLDLTQSVAGPFATQMLAGLGATVVKLEPPSGDSFREHVNGSMFTATNMGGKQSIGVNLRTEEGQEIARELAAEADVIIQALRVGALEKYDLDYEAVAESNESIVYCSISGFGQDGPYHNWPAYDPAIQAMSGVMSTTGYPDRPPVRVGTSIVDFGTGMTAALSIVSAVLQRELTGDGEFIDVSMLEVATTWMGYWIANYSGTGEVPTRSGQGFAGIAPNEVFPAKGDEYFYLAVATERQYERLCKEIDREDLLEDERFEDFDARWDHREALKEELTETFTQYTCAEITEKLAMAGIPAGPLQDVEDIVEDDEHLRARGFLTETYNQKLDETVETAGVPFETSEGRQQYGGDPPKLGEHTRRILTSLGYDPERVDEFIAEGVVTSND